MIIDFHTHVFSDKIVERTIAHLSATGGIPAHSDGTVDGLVKRLNEAGADLAVALPVLTKPTQFDGVNNFAEELNQKGLPVLSFGGIHPLCENKREKIKLLKEMGFKGVKIHPDYQETFFDAPEYIEILEAAAKFDLIVVTHAGVDGGYRDKPVRCTPDRVLNVLKLVPSVKLVLAHLGGNELYGEVYDKLAGKEVYFDTAYSMHDLNKAQFTALTTKHGADRILFATDSPWRDIREEVELLRSFNLEKQTEDKIFYKNAVKLLGL